MKTKTSGRRQSTKKSARTLPRRASKSEPKLTELGFHVERLPNGDTQITLSEWLATRALPVALTNYAQFFNMHNMSQIQGALIRMAHELRRDGVTIDG
jgi:hypothetical protein